MARITKLKVENFKRIEAVEIEPQGNVTIVGGMNEQGKSALLDAITVLLQGKLAKIPEPVRKGAKKATIEGDIKADEWDAFDDLHIFRSISATGNWTIKVESKNGIQKSPETLLKKIFGDPIDPVAFVRMGAKERLETVKRLVGLDFTDLDAERKRMYDERTMVGRDVTILEGAIKSIQTYPDAPEGPVSVAALMEELNKRKAINRDIDSRKDAISILEKDHENTITEGKRLKAQLAELKQKFEKEETSLEDMRGKLEDMTPADEAEIEKQIAESETINEKIRTNQSLKEKSADLKIKQAEYEGFTKKIEQIDNTKADQLAAAKFPVDGLSFDDSQVLYKGLPFDEKQLSSEELLRVSFAMSIAANPTLKNILIREGSLLDKNNLALIGQMAEENGIGVFIEVVTEDSGNASLIIENGRVKGAAEIVTAGDDYSDI